MAFLSFKERGYVNSGVIEMASADSPGLINRPQKGGQEESPAGGAEVEDPEPPHDPPATPLQPSRAFPSPKAQACFPRPPSGRSGSEETVFAGAFLARDPEKLSRSTAAQAWMGVRFGDLSPPSHPFPSCLCSLQVPPKPVQRTDTHTHTKSELQQDFIIWG